MLAREPVPELEALGVTAFTTTRDAGTFGTSGSEPVGEVMARWSLVRASLAARAPRFVTAHQVHGSRVIAHDATASWAGWLRATDADGHAAGPGVAMAVTVADCVPVFLLHPSGVGALLHSGWRGTEARIVLQGLAALAARGASARDVVLHLGPAICGRCYEVSPDVYQRLTGTPADHAICVDLRGLIEAHARAAGVRQVTTSPWCTRCDADRFFSHRAGDTGRQIAVLALPRD